MTCSAFIAPPRPAGETTIIKISAPLTGYVRKVSGLRDTDEPPT